jgi:threonine aldolase
MAELYNHEVGVFLLSGTIGNQIALRTLLTQPPHSVLCDHRAHILCVEAGVVSMLACAMVNGVVPSNGVYISPEDIESNVIRLDDCHACPAKVISLENMLCGLIGPLKEVQRVSGFAGRHGIKMHSDGARLWEAVAAGAGSLSECGAACFDSITLYYSNGPGAPVGSIFGGRKAFIKQARWIRQAIDDTLRRPGALVAAARNAVNVNFGVGSNGKVNGLKRTHAIAQRIEAFQQSLDGSVALPVDTNMVWIDHRPQESWNRFANTERRCKRKWREVGKW